MKGVACDYKKVYFSASHIKCAAHDCNNVYIKKKAMYSDPYRVMDTWLFLMHGQLLLTT